MCGDVMKTEGRYMYVDTQEVSPVSLITKLYRHHIANVSGSSSSTDVQKRARDSFSDIISNVSTLCLPDVTTHEKLSQVFPLEVVVD